VFRITLHVGDRRPSSVPTGSPNIDSLNVSTSGLSAGDNLFGTSPFDFLGPLSAGVYTIDLRAFGDSFGANAYRFNLVAE
jgi:hypothetical protein